uniref:FMN-binding protein n=1 Tax=Streptomyces beigongshangae TaxID=2841597 RepID=UPI001C85783C
MKRAIPILVLTVAGLVPVWRYAPSDGSATTTEAASPAPAPSAPAAGSGGGSARVVKGSTVDTEKGPVQVEVAFDGDEITAVKLLRQPDHPQTEAAVPKLVAATLEEQS